ncbi:Up-regulated during septation-domain-containing protein [Scleroderma yunnanense]
MNGVRRLWGGGRTSPAAPQPEPAPTPSPPVPTTASHVKPPWSPQSSPPTSPLAEELPTASTPGLVIRKDKAKLISIASPAGGSRNGTSMHSPAGSSDSYAIPSPSGKSLPNGTSGFPSSPAGGALSSPVPPPSSGGLEWKRTSGLVNTRDELLMSLLASEAIIDSRDCEILSAEEVEELKKEHHVLKIRLVAVEQKLKLEIKIRDAAQSLSRVNAAHRKVSKQTEEQLEAAERKVAVVQKEYWRISERTSEVHRKLLEHCTGILGYSVQKIEKRINPLTNVSSEFSVSGVTTPNRASTVSSVPSHAASSKARFEGAHLFAGHADAQVPRLPPSTSGVAALEAKLRAATESLNAANKQQAEMARELQQLQLEREQLQSTTDAEMQRANETVAALEKELPRFEELQAKYNELDKERSKWEEDQAKLTAREREVERLERRLEVLEEKSGETSEMEKMLTDIQRKADSEMQQKEEDISALGRQIMEAREQWEAEKESMEENRLAEVGVLQEELETLRISMAARAELDEAVDALHELMRQHDIQHSADDRSLQTSLASLNIHLEKLSEVQDNHRMAQGEWEVERKRLESELRAQYEARETACADRERLRRERDEAKREITEMDSRIRALNAPSLYSGPPIEYKGEVADVVALLQPAWAVLPAPELRAPKLNTRRHLRMTSTASSPGGQSKSGLPSLSDMDVRSLKAVYDAKSPQAAVGGPFSIEAFVARVQALIIDDRALIERLIRFAQAHEMLKKNAERAQKLAQDSNTALGTYKKQVTALENQNHVLVTRQTALCALFP